MIAVLTAPRANGFTYLASTLAAVDSSATSAQRVVLLDGTETIELPPAWRLVHSPRPVQRCPQNKHSAWKAFQLAAAAEEDLILLEDDLRLCLHAARRMEDIAVPPDVAFLSFYAPYGEAGTPPGILREPVTAFNMAQAIKFPLCTCKKLLGEARRVTAMGARGTDEVLRTLGGGAFGVHHPGLVQHVGAESAAGDGGLGLRYERTSPAYAGDAFDALTLRF